MKDPAGQTSLTKQVLPVSSNTELGPARQIEQGRNVDQTNRSRTILQTFANDFYYGNGGENQGKRMTLAQAAGVLNKKRGFNDALVLGRINMKSPIANFLRLFHQLFEVDGELFTGEGLASRSLPGAAKAHNQDSN